MLIYADILTYRTKKTMCVHTPSLKRKKQYDLTYDELDLEN